MCDMKCISLIIQVSLDSKIEKVINNDFFYIVCSFFFSFFLKALNLHSMYPTSDYKKEK